MRDPRYRRRVDLINEDAGTIRLGITAAGVSASERACARSGFVTVGQLPIIVTFTQLWNCDLIITDYFREANSASSRALRS